VRNSRGHAFVSGCKGTIGLEYGSLDHLIRAVEYDRFRLKARSDMRNILCLGVSHLALALIFAFLREFSCSSYSRREWL
jgi:hypothetical protein